MKHVLSKFIALIARKAAYAAHGSASQWMIYQPEEPECLRTAKD